MAQLPPKVPNMTHNWPSLSHQKIPSMSNFVPNNSSHQHSSAVSSSTTNIVNNHQQLQPSWVDEFLDFSSSRRGAHRRSVSADSIAFLDSPPSLDECRNSSSNNGGALNMAEANCFDRLDDEQLVSMFSDDVSITLPPTTASSSNPSTPSDQNSNNDDKTTPLDPRQHQHQNQQHHHQQPKNEPGEVESSCQFEAQPTQTPPTSNADQIIDPKRVKRILANRQSAQRSRVRKLQYISELERSVTTLQTEVSALSPRVAFLDHQRLILNVDNSTLKQRIAALTQDKIFKDAHQEALKKEIERLRQVYHQQNIKKINTNTNNNAPPPPATSAAPPQPTSAETMVCTDKDQQLLN